MEVETIHAPLTPEGTEGVLALIMYYRPDRPDGVSFVTGKTEPLQVGHLKHQAGKVIPPHTHYPHTRCVYTTQEVLVVLRGRVRVTIYTHGGDRVASRDLCRGDLVVLVAGGHGFEILEDCEMYEVKQGPYYSQGQDKRMLYAPLPVVPSE